MRTKEGHLVTVEPTDLCCLDLWIKSCWLLIWSCDRSQRSDLARHGQSQLSSNLMPNYFSFQKGFLSLGADSFKSSPPLSEESFFCCSICLDCLDSCLCCLNVAPLESAYTAEHLQLIYRLLDLLSVAAAHTQPLIFRLLQWYSSDVSLSLVQKRGGKPEYFQLSGTRLVSTRRFGLKILCHIHHFNVLGCKTESFIMWAGLQKMPPRPLAQRLELVRLCFYGVCCSHGCLWVVHRNPEPSSDGGGAAPADGCLGGGRKEG